MDADFAKGATTDTPHTPSQADGTHEQLTEAVRERILNVLRGSCSGHNHNGKTCVKVAHGNVQPATIARGGGPLERCYDHTAGEKRLVKIASKHFRISYFWGAQGV